MGLLPDCRRTTPFPPSSLSPPAATLPLLAAASRSPSSPASAAAASACASGKGQLLPVPVATSRVSSRRGIILNSSTRNSISSSSSIRNGNGNSISSSRARALRQVSTLLTSPCRAPGRRNLTVTCAAMAEEVDLQGQAIAEDYYSVLGLNPYATQEEIKQAYYSCMRVCHPDLSNNHPDSVASCSFINEVYEVLSDPEMRAVYDEIKGYSTTGVNPFLDTEAERDFCFVDEFTCIGCKNCANCAEATFEIEEMWGRSRVMNQRADSSATVQEAIDTCPVNCIHWVSAGQLALLEDEMRRMERVSVGTMMAGQGLKGADVFQQASMRWEKRRRMVEAKARVEAEKERRKQQAREDRWGWDGGFWGSATSTSGASTGAADAAADAAASSSASDSDEDGGARRRRVRPSKERMEKAAAAARRWREYSQKGVDRRRRGLAIAENKWEEIELPASLVKEEVQKVEEVEDAVALK